jgi:hypothetical protein
MNSRGQTGTKLNGRHGSTHKRLHNTNNARDSLLRIRVHDLRIGNSPSHGKAAETEQLDIVVVDIVALDRNRVGQNRSYWAKEQSGVEPRDQAKMV